MKRESWFKMINISWTMYVLPKAIARVFEYFYNSEEQPTYEEAEKELWISRSTIYHHINTLVKLGIIKKDKRWTLKYIG